MDPNEASGRKRVAKRIEGEVVPPLTLEKLKQVQSRPMPTATITDWDPGNLRELVTPPPAEVIGTDSRAIIKKSKMSKAMEDAAVASAKRALTRAQNNEEMAGYIRKEFDTDHKPKWHCIVGSGFASDMANMDKDFIYFSVGQLDILLFQTD